MVSVAIEFGILVRPVHDGGPASLCFVAIFQKSPLAQAELDALFIFKGD
jgi:hypothetical protein